MSTKLPNRLARGSQPLPTISDLESLSETIGGLSLSAWDRHFVPSPRPDADRGPRSAAAEPSASEPVASNHAGSASKRLGQRA